MEIRYGNDTTGLIKSDVEEIGFITGKCDKTYLLFLIWTPRPLKLIFYFAVFNAVFSNTL